MTLTLAAIEYGDPSGAPLLALHGGLGTKELWEWTATEGVPQRRWICLDLRGHGDSPAGTGPWTLEQHARDVIETIDAMRVGRVDVIGQSAGGRIAMEVANRAPDRIETVVLLDPPLMTREEWHQLDAIGESTVTLAHREFDTVEEWLALSMPPEGLPPRAQPHAHRARTAALERTVKGRLKLRIDPEAMRGLLDDVGLHFPCTFGAFSGRVLLIAGDRYAAVTEDGHAALRSELGDRLTSVILDAGHQLYWEAFDETCAHVKAFLDT